jgi:Glycosyl hydrolases family 2, TIM barrel domain/Glycosyl hydrolases family 2, sugar binding domain/Glycosyl hydrolases family 2/Beta galactosidase small chain
MLMHRRHLHVALGALAIVLSWSAYAGAAGPTDTFVRYLSGTDKDHTVPWDFMVTGGRRAGEWTTIPVPSNWELQGFGAYNYGTEQDKADEQGLYRHHFTVPADWRGRTVFVVFEGSMTDTEVTVNGQPAGPVHQGAFYEFRYDVTALLKFGEDNLLEVTVSKQSANPSVNRAERDADFWVFGGIFRPVYLAASPPEHVDRTAIAAGADGSFRMQVALAGVAQPAAVVARIETMDGTPAGAAFSAPVRAGGTEVTLSTRLTGVQAWNAERPVLYRVRISLVRGQRVLHTTVERFGFRTIEVRERDGIYVNGAKVMLRGVDHHVFWPESGRTSSRERSVEDVNLIKDMNMNAVRMSHYPPDKHFLDVCDELGLYVLDELTGWQKAYDTEVGTRLVREMVERDRNHPSILFWDNGNEGGFNTDLDPEFPRYDLQHRRVLHPWDTFSGVDTTHYQSFDCCAGQYIHGHNLIMPTEFQHGLYDGGAGAGLADMWGEIERNPLGAGGFIWVFADEGVVRTDRNGEIDTHGNNAPDGILGPHHEKEGSFYTIKQLWSPVRIDQPLLPPDFDGRLPVENHYNFTNLDACRFRWHVLDFPDPTDGALGHRVALVGAPEAPSVPPGGRGTLVLALPDGWRRHDALEVAVWDPTGRELSTWRWMLRSPAEIARKVLPPASGTARYRESGDTITLQAGGTEVDIAKSTARLLGVRRDGTSISIANGPRPVEGDATLKALRHVADGDAQVVEAELDGAIRLIRWRLSGSGVLTLDYRLRPSAGRHDYIGVTFDYPPDRVTGLRWLGRGPYRVWRNRMEGVTFDVWEKAANDGVTGAVWKYPEFRGHHADLYWATLSTTEGPITIVSETEGIFLRVLTPTFPSDARYTAVPFPEGDVSILHAIAPMGTKFQPAAALGPSGQPNLVNGRTGTYEGRIDFYFEGQLTN